MENAFSSLKNFIVIHIIEDLDNVFYIFKFSRDPVARNKRYLMGNDDDK